MSIFLADALAAVFPDDLSWFADLTAANLAAGLGPAPHSITGTQLPIHLELGARDTRIY